LRWYVKEYHQKFSIEVDFQATGFRERLPAEMETALYRIIQESLTNIARHSLAQKASVTLKEEKDAVYATISDDGRGFNVEKLQKTAGQERGLGLVGMHERAHLLDGTLTIESLPGDGTIVQVRIPLYSTNAPREKTSKLTVDEVSS
jgi:two-component system sensor histidine kinase UhpB